MNTSFRRWRIEVSRLYASVNVTENKFNSNFNLGTGEDDTKRSCNVAGVVAEDILRYIIRYMYQVVTTGV